MQTFLPYPDFKASASVLDWRRLGKQRVECEQILKAITDPNYSWQNHPAVNMWRGYTRALAEYGCVICNEWIERGYRDSMYVRIRRFIPNEHPAVLGRLQLPHWFGDLDFHLMHRRVLLAKDPDWYSQFFDCEPAIAVNGKWPYVWPV